MTRAVALKKRLPKLKSATSQNAESRSRTLESPALQTVGFAAFILWLFQFPRVILADFTTAYFNTYLLFVPFVIAFAVFALLARSRKLPRVHATMTVTSVVAAVLGVCSVVSYTIATAMGLLMVLMVLAAYFLVAWGSILRNMTLSAAFMLVFVAVGISGLVQLLFALFALGTGMGTMHTYATLQLGVIAFMPLLSGLYFFRTTTEQSAKQGFSRSDVSWHLGINWRSTEFMPFVVILLIGSVLLHFINGYTYSPNMFNGMYADVIRASVEVAIALLVLLLVRFNPHTIATSIKFAFMVVLVITVVGVALLLLGKTGVFYSWGVLVALGDVFFGFALVFCVSPSDGNRGAFFARYILAILCSGLFWAYGLGNIAKRLFGFDLDIITGLAILTLAALALLLLFAATKTLPPLKADTVAEAPDKERSVPDTVALEPPTIRDILEQYHQNLRPFNLTNRETQVALLMVKGHTAESAGARLGIASGTVVYHLKHTYKKCAVANRGELVALITQGTDDAWQ